MAVTEHLHPVTELLRPATTVLLQVTVLLKLHPATTLLRLGTGYLRVQFYLGVEEPVYRRLSTTTTKEGVTGTKTTTLDPGVVAPVFPAGTTILDRSIQDSLRQDPDTIRATVLVPTTSAPTISAQATTLLRLRSKITAA